MVLFQAAATVASTAHENSGPKNAAVSLQSMSVRILVPFTVSPCTQKKNLSFFFTKT
jgi:hypothetical protein